MKEIYFYINNYKKKTLGFFGYKHYINITETFVNSNNKRFKSNLKMIYCRNEAIDFMKWRRII